MTCTATEMLKLELNDRVIGNFTREELAHMRQVINLVLGAQMSPEEQAIVDAVCVEFRLTGQQLFISGKAAWIAWPRQIAMSLMRSRLKHPFTAIGALFGKDHGTVMHACRVVTQRSTCHNERRQIDAVIARL